jgi:hypothetical protein
MLLPYTAEVYFSAMARYNAAWFPAVLLGWLAMAGAAALAARPPHGSSRLAGRIAAALLAGVWIWTGWAHQLQLMAPLNFMAPIYGWAWIAQGALLALVGTLAGRLPLAWRGDATSRVGLILVLAGLVLHPLAVLALGHPCRGLPLAGTAPDATAIVTAGLLLLTAPGPALACLVVPLGWGGVAGLSAWLLGFPLDAAVPGAVLLVIALTIGRMAQAGRRAETSRPG